MSRTSIEFDYKNTHYTLCYTINSLKELERRGFSFNNAGDHILTAGEDLFCASFDAYHKNVPRKIREEIYRELCDENENGQSLTEALISMVGEVLEEMNPKGNVQWAMTKG